MLIVVPVNIHQHLGQVPSGYAAHLGHLVLRHGLGFGSVPPHLDPPPLVGLEGGDAFTLDHILEVVEARGAVGFHGSGMCSVSRSRRMLAAAFRKKKGTPISRGARRKRTGKKTVGHPDSPRGGPCNIIQEIAPTQMKMKSQTIGCQVMTTRSCVPLGAGSMRP
jgi:hypothetical protein